MLPSIKVFCSTYSNFMRVMSWLHDHQREWSGGTCENGWEIIVPVLDSTEADELDKLSKHSA